MNEPIRTGTFKRQVAALVAVAVLGASLGGARTAHAQTAPQRPDGTTLYEALFFGQGLLASAIPTLRDATPYLPAEYLALAPKLKAMIQERDPRAFPSFAEEILSEDRVRVSEALRTMQKRHREALFEATRNVATPFAAETRRLRNMLTAARPPEAENDGNVAVALIVFVVLFVAVVWAAPPQVETFKGLSFERFVDEIVGAVSTQ